jgi:hypothetical protein
VVTLTCSDLAGLDNRRSDHVGVTTIEDLLLSKPVRSEHVGVTTIEDRDKRYFYPFLKATWPQQFPNPCVECRYSKLSGQLILLHILSTFFCGDYLPVTLDSTFNEVAFLNGQCCLLLHMFIHKFIAPLPPLCKSPLHHSIETNRCNTVINSDID